MKSPRLAALVGLLGSFATFTACPNCAPDTVGEGVARLTVRNVGAMVSLASADTACGFASDAVVVTVNGEVGKEGTVTSVITDCTIDAGSNTQVSESCTGNATTASGAFTITATRTVGGILTGDATNPIVPGGPDAVTISLDEVTFDDFLVEVEGSDNSLRMIDGSLSATFQPRLAVAASSGACAVVTPNVTFTDIAYGESTVFVTTPDNQFEADITTSSINAQNGKKGEVENNINGRMTVFGSDVEIEGDGLLDPDYDAADFAAGYACTPDLATPESFECIDLTPRLADGAARLAVKSVGTLASILDADTTCGFSSAAVLGAGVPAGTVGGDGSLTLTITDCTVTFATDTELGDDCLGNSTVVRGSVTVSGTKTVSGRFTGSATTPIVPDSDNPAVFVLTATGDDFFVGSTNSENALTLETGTLAGTVAPRTALSGETGSCSIATPNARISDVAVAGDVLVRSASGTFALTLASTDIDATNGTVGDDENAIAGTVVIGDDTFTVPGDGDGLDPAYDAAAFDSAYTCNPELVSPVNFQCTFVAPIAQGVAALSARTFGTVVSLVDANTACGFSAPAVAGTPVFSAAVGSDAGTATFTLGGAGCTITLPADTQVATDCSGNTTAVGGTVVVTGQKVVAGYNTGNPLQPVVPTASDAATFTLSMTFTDFSVVSSASEAVLAIDSGVLSGSFSPRLFIDTTTGACSTATPNAAFDGLTWTNAAVTLRSGDLTFDATIATSDVDAQNGVGATTNTLGGSVTVDGVPFTVGGPLDPAFDQAAFDATYTCDPDGAGPRAAPVAPPNEAACSFRQTLGNAAARLLVKHTGAAISAVDGNTGCGFSSAAVVGGAVVTGNAGGPGNVTFSTAACPTPIPEPGLASPNCLGVETVLIGTVTSTATKSVDGLLTGNPANPVVPLSENAVTFNATSLAFDAFQVFDRPTGGSPAVRATVTGTLSAVVEPITGQSESVTAQIGGTPAFTIRTGIAALSDITMATGTLTLVNQGSTFTLALTDVALDAFNGSFDGESNSIEGALTVDGEDVTLAAGNPLDPAFVQATFDSTYSCNPDLVEPVAP